MKKIFVYIISAISAIMLAASCGLEEPQAPIGPETPSGDKVYTLSVKADKVEVSPSTKALDIENVAGKNYLRSSWKTTEKIYAHKGYTDAVIGTLQPATDGKSAVLTGTISGTYKKEDHITFSYPGETSNCDYTGQDGTLETIAARYDYAQAYGYVATVDGDNNITLENALSFTSMQAVVKFKLVDVNNNPIYPTKLCLTARNSMNQDLISLKTGTDASKGTLEVDVDQTTPHNEFYVAIDMFDQVASNFTIEAKLGELVTYGFTATGVQFDEGSYYEVNVKMNNTVVPSLASLKYNFNFTDNGSPWNKAGKVFLFFSGVTTGYYRAEYNGTDWSGTFVDLGETDVKKLVSNGKVTAVWGKHLTSQTPVFSDGKWSFGSGVEGFEYLGADKAPYTVGVVQEGSPAIDYLCLNSTINLVTPAVTGIDIKTGKNSSATYKFACNNLIPIGFSSVAADGTITELSAGAGDWINVLQQNDVSYAYGKVVESPQTLYYYALSRTRGSEYSCFHLLDNSGARLAVGADGYASMCPDQDDWIQAGPNHFVELMGRQWWTTNLASDRYSALPDPWTTAELKWSSAESQWVENRHLLSLSVATFDYNSELPNVFNYTNEKGYIYQISQVCGTKGLIFANNSELTEFIFLPLADHEDYEFYVNIVGTPLTRKLNWHYWTKDYYEKVLYHTGAPDYQYQTNSLKWSFFMTATIHIHEPNGYPYYYRPNNPEEYNGVPDYGYRFTDNEVPLYFPARPVVKQSN